VAKERRGRADGLLQGWPVSNVLAFVRSRVGEAGLSVVIAFVPRDYARVGGDVGRDDKFLAAMRALWHQHASGGRWEDCVVEGRFRWLRFPYKPAMLWGGGVGGGVAGKLGDGGGVFCGGATGIARGFVACERGSA